MKQKEEEKNVSYRYFSSTQKGKFQSASTFFELCVCITFRVSGIYNYRLFTTLFILLKELSRINTLRIVGLFVYQLLTLSWKENVSFIIIDEKGWKK